MLGLCLTTLLALPAQAAAPAQAAPAAPAAPAPKALSFQSQKLAFHWDRTIPLDLSVDGLKINSIFFNKRAVNTWPLKGADFGTRAVVEVTNLSNAVRVPGFAVAVFDAEHRLLGVASGGTKIFPVSPGETTTFDMSFSQVKERLPKGTYFHLSVELSD